VSPVSWPISPATISLAGAVPLPARTYGLLEQKIDCCFRSRTSREAGTWTDLFRRLPNSLDVTTYVASKLEGGVRWTNTSIHLDSSPSQHLHLRVRLPRVKVELTVSRLLQGDRAVGHRGARGGPALTWIRDTRDSRSMRTGTYTSFRISSPQGFGAQLDSTARCVQFQLLDLRQGRFVLARKRATAGTRLWRAEDELIPLPSGFTPRCNLAARFSMNAAGPAIRRPATHRGRRAHRKHRDAPAPPTLPCSATRSASCSSTIWATFHQRLDAWASALRIHQRTEILHEHHGSRPPKPARPVTSTGWQACAASTTFAYAGLVCVTIRRLGPSGWTSAIT